MLSFYTYKIPFKSPFKISKVDYSNREGIIAKLDFKENTIYAETAPLAPFSSETLHDCKNWITQNGTQFLENLNHNSEADFIPYPSLRFMYDMLRVQMHSIQKGYTSLSEYFQKNQKSVGANATVGAGSASDILARITDNYEQGYRSFKLKVGRDTKNELRLIESLRNKYSDVEIRLDANGAWITGDAVNFLKKCAPFKISYCEQPIPAGMETHFPEVEMDSGIAVAADESIRNVKDCQYLLEHELCSVLIVKPMLIGSLSDLKAIAELSKAKSVKVVITTSLESGIGRSQTAILASVFGDDCSHGLATGQLLEDSVFDDAYLLRNGNYTLPLFDDYKKVNLSGEPFVVI